MIVDKRKILDLFKETGYTITGIGVFRNVNNVQMLIDTNLMIIILLDLKIFCNNKWLHSLFE